MANLTDVVGAFIAMAIFVTAVTVDIRWLTGRWWWQ